MLFVSAFNFVPFYLKPKIMNPVYADYVGQGMITFSYDDGSMDNYTTALPLHEKYNIPATFNVNTRYLIHGATQADTHFGVKEIAYSEQRGAEIASHSHTHPNLTTLNESNVLLELNLSKNMLSKYVSRIETFAVPDSQYNATTRDIIANSGDYVAARVYSNEQNSIPPIDLFWLKSSLALGSSHIFATNVKPVIDSAVTNKTWCILMLHKVIENPTGVNITPAMLEQILSYVVSLGRNQLLPINTRDGVRFTTGLGDYY